jgi:tetratricopeptide (TPR) repeat protein
MTRKANDVLEQNVSTLLESGGEPPRIGDIARARIRDELVAKHGAIADVVARRRVPVLAIGLGLAATAATVVVVATLAGKDAPAVVDNMLADGTTYVARGDAKLTVLGPRRVRVEGEVLLDVAPGKGTFVVETAAGRIDVLGTRFVVAAQAQQTFTAVVRGEVKLASDHGSVVVHAGEQAIAALGRAPVRGPAPRLSHLVSWARSARHREETTIEPLRNGSLFARDPGVRPSGQFGEEYPLPLRQLTLDVVVADQVARVALDQTFHNAQPRVLEGVYKFAIPPDAALQRLAMYVDGKLTESAVVERMRARRIYEELVYRRIDPALLEYAGTGRLNLRVYPLPAQQDKRLMLAYTQSLPKLYGDYTLAIPLPEVDQPVGEMVVNARIEGCANCELSSPSHRIDVERSGEDAIVRYRRAAEKIGDSFIVHVRDSRKQTTAAAHADGNDRYLLVRAPVELGGAAREYRPRTWVILDDVSASRSPLELKAQADLVDAFLSELDEHDKVALIAFDVEARQKLAPTRVIDVDRRVVRQALKQEGGVGATDFRAGLAAALRLVDGTRPEDAMIVYLGDGVITSGPRGLDELRRQLAGKAQFVGVGVGDGPDTQTLDALAAATGGYSTTIDLADDVRWRAFDLVATLHTSRVTGLSARLVDAEGQLVPATAYLRSAQLADGEELQLVAKLAGGGVPAAVELAGRATSGTPGGAPWRHRVELAGTRGNAGYLPRIWAQHHVTARLLAKHEPVVVPPCVAQPALRGRAAIACPTEAELRAQRDEDIRKEIVAFGKQYFLLSRHTSLLVLENDAMYAQYGVRKGSGETWAPYAMPATIPVTTTAALPANLADDAELVREPLQIFYPQYHDGWLDDDQAVFGGAGGATIGLGRFGTLGQGSGTGSGFGAGGLRGRGVSVADQTRATLGLARVRAQVDRAEGDVDVAGASVDERRFRRTVAAKAAADPFDADKRGPMVPAPRTSVSSRELRAGELQATRFRRANRHHATSYGVGALQPMRLTYPTDTAFDDVTAFVPGLVPGAFDEWRDDLRAITGNPAAFPIDDGARRLLAAARAQLPSGVYRWNDVELTVDAARNLGWRRTTGEGLVEHGAVAGTRLSRSYPELGLVVEREVSDDQVAVSLAYLPLWIAEPDQYARWFAVKLRGTREVELSRPVQGALEVAFVLAFDASSRLVAIRDGSGTALLEVTWSAAGPTTARAGADDVAVGFRPVASARVALELQDAVTIELPTRIPSYWHKRVAAEASGTPAWRHVQRQLMASAAAVGDRPALYRAYTELREHGGVVLGDLALASGGLATATTDAQLAQALAPASIASTALARYLVAGRAYGKSPTPARIKPQTQDGLLGALWTLRHAEALSQAREHRAAVDALVALGDRAFTLGLVGASRVTSVYDIEATDVMRAWDSVARGEYKNVARAQAAQTLQSRGKHDAAADQWAKLAAELDLDALPPQMNVAAYQLNYSRRGPAGYHLIYATWRDRVLAGESFAHVMAIVPQAAQHPPDLSRVLARAAELARKSGSRQLAVARAALQHGQQALAQTLLEPMLKASPTREMYQLAARIAQMQSRHADALGYLERAQEAAANEPVELATIRSELTQVVQLAQQVAVQSTGAARMQAVERALDWAARWRLVDPGNTHIDQLLGDLLLAVGDTTGAWRQLSSMIERDPWSGSGYIAVADKLERQGRVADALELWQQAIVIEQTNPIPRLRKAQALFALGRTAEGDALLEQVANGTWHDIWTSTVSQAKNLLERGRRRPAP